MHRDLKPQNLLVSLGGQLKIADFGLARAFVPPVRPFTHEVVTLWYRPPEILLGEKTYALPVDLWAVGAILVEMLNKRPLFPGDSEIDELFKIFRIMGTPCETNWKEGTCLPDFNRVWPMWPTLDLAKCVPSLSPSGLNLLEGLLCLDPRDRLSASEASSHAFFEGCSLLANSAQLTAPAPASAFAHVRGPHGPGVPVTDAAPGAGDAVTGKTASAFTFHRGVNNKENATGEPALKMAKGMR
jgi:serine/threonine protein kinase